METTDTDKQTTTFDSNTRFYACPKPVLGRTEFDPGNVNAKGFFFGDGDDWKAKAKACRNDFGDPVEEFAIQFIDGDDLDYHLFSALRVSQATIVPFIEKLDEWDEQQKTTLIIAVGECGYDFDIGTDDPDQFDVDCYTDMTLSDLAYQFVDEGLFGDIPDHLTRYIDYDAIARDLAHDYTAITINGEQCVYRCGCGQ